jgi:hypothetical protein
MAAIVALGRLEPTPPGGVRSDALLGDNSSQDDVCMIGARRCGGGRIGGA